MVRKNKKRPHIIRAWSLSPCPNGRELIEAWSHRRDSQASFIQLLSVLGELACYMDFELDHQGGFGNIRGRKGGFKDFIMSEAPELAPKYKTLSRFMKLATRIKEVFQIYPPAQLSLMHPDLPLPRINCAFMTNHCRKLYRDYFKNLKPRFQDFDRAITLRLMRKGMPKLCWGHSLPLSEWQKAELTWRRRYVYPNVLREIDSMFSFYSRDYRRKMDY